MIGERLDPNTPTATLQIYNFIEEYLGRKGKDPFINRGSAASRCYKQRWYQGREFPGEKLTPRALVNFTLGDLSEHTVKYFIAHGCVGDGKLYSQVNFGQKTGSFTIQNGKEITLYEQPDLTTDVDGILVICHADGWGKRNSDGKWELIEVKSAADFGFDEFKENGPGTYLKQAMVNLQSDFAKTLEAQEVRFFYLKKNTGHLWDAVFPFDPKLFQEIAKEYYLSNQETEPSAPYSPIPETFRRAPTGRTVLPWQCGYCAYVSHCQKDFELEFKNGKPIFVQKRRAE